MSYNPQNPNGQATSANSAPVVIASDQSAVPVSVSGGATAAHQTDGSQKTQIVDGSGSVISSTSNALNVNVASGSINGTTNLTQVGSSAISLGNTTMSASLPVTLASNDTNTAPFVAAGAGGYVRQDSTATIAKESGGNLATIAGAVTASKMNVSFDSGSTTGINDGNHTANVKTGDQNGLVVNNNTKTINFSTSTTGAQTLLADTDCRGYTFLTVVIQSVGTSLSWVGQWAPNSGGTYATVNSFTTITAGGVTPYNSLSTSVNTCTTSIYGDYFQLNISAMTGGTTSGYVILSSLPHNPTAIAGIVGSISTNTSGSITTASSSVVQSGLQSYNSGFVPISIHGTYAGVSFGITMSDDNGTTFYNTAVFNSSTASWIAPGATITPGTNASVVYWVPIPPNSSSSTVKLLASAYTSGTATVRIGGAGESTQPGSYMSQIMDAAGNARGANVDSANNLNTHDVASSATGSAVPGSAHYIGMLSGSNLAGIQAVGTTGDGSGTSAIDVGGRNFNGTSWDRNRSAPAASGTTGTGLLGTGSLGIYNTSAPTASNGNYYPLQLDNNANLKVNVVTGGSTFTVQPGNTPNTTPWLVSLSPSTSGGWSVSSQTALTNTVVSVKSSAGQFGGYMFNNPNAATMYIQIFNVASGSVTLGTTAPTYVIPIPAASSANVEFANGIAHATAISAAAATTATGNAAPTTSLTGFFIYK